MTKTKGKILHTTWGYGMTINDFCEVVRETDSNMWCEELETKQIEGPAPGVAGHGQYGKEIPISRRKKNFKTIRIKKAPVKEWYVGRSGSAGSTKLWCEWDGKAESFNYMD